MRKKLLAVILILSLSGTAQAALIDRGGGMVYDNVLDITWLSDANMGGPMNWEDSVAWADNLVFGGFDDWRLASMNVDGDDGFTGVIGCASAGELLCRDNELGYMFYYNLMGGQNDDLTGTQGLFTNIMSHHWSGTEYSPYPSIAFSFFFHNGSHDTFGKDSVMGAWAVRSGDVLAPVPVPAAIWFMVSGIGALLAMRRSIHRE